MKKTFIHRLLGLALLSAASLCPTVQAYTTGQFLTGNTSTNNFSSVTVGPGNVFYGAWKSNEPTPSTVHFVKIATFNGTSWTEVPGASFTNTQTAAQMGGLTQINSIDRKSLAVDSSGNIHIAFAASDPGVEGARGVAYGKFTAATSTWAFRRILILQSVTNGFLNVDDYTMTLDASGNPHILVVWSDAHDDPIRENRMIHAFFNGSVWNVTGATNAKDGFQVDIASGNNQEEIKAPDVVLDSAGDLHCCYHKEDLDSLSGDCWYVKRTGTTWGTPAEVADLNNFVQGSIALDSSGKVMIGSRFNTTNTATYRVTSNASGSWVTTNVSTFTVPGAATLNVNDVILGINSAGLRVMVNTVKGNNSISNHLRVIYETSPDTWTQEQPITDAGTLTYNFPSMALRSDGTIMALFHRQVVSTERNVYFASGIPTGFGGGPVTTAPTVTTAAQSAVTHNSATLGGNVTADGGASVTERGIVWGLALNPTTANTKVANGSGTGVFSGTVTGLPSNTLVHVRAYAINSVNTSYGNDISFTTLPAPVAVTSLTRVGAAVQNGGFVFWNLTFASPVTGLSASNFSLSGAAATGSGVASPGTSTGGLVWNIPVSTGSTDGTLTLNLANSTGLSATISNTPFPGESYTIDKTPPTVLSVTRLAPAGQNTNLTTVTFRVTYSEPVALNAPAANRYQVVPVNGSTIVGTVTGVTGSGDTRDVTVNLTSGTGEFRLRVID